MGGGGRVRCSANYELRISMWGGGGGAALNISATARPGLLHPTVLPPVPPSLPSVCLCCQPFIMNPWHLSLLPTPPTCSLFFSLSLNSSGHLLIRCVFIWHSCDIFPWAWFPFVSAVLIMSITVSESFFFFWPPSWCPEPHGYSLCCGALSILNSFARDAVHFDAQVLALLFSSSSVHRCRYLRY